MSEQNELAEAIRELRQSNNGLQEAVGGLQEAVGGLQETVARNTEAVDRNTETLSDQATGLHGLTNALLDRQEAESPRKKVAVGISGRGTSRRGGLSR